MMLVINLYQKNLIPIRKYKKLEVRQALIMILIYYLNNFRDNINSTKLSILSMINTKVITSQHYVLSNPLKRKQLIKLKSFQIQKY